VTTTVRRFVRGPQGAFLPFAARTPWGLPNEPLAPLTQRLSDAVRACLAMISLVQVQRPHYHKDRSAKSPSASTLKPSSPQRSLGGVGIDFRLVWLQALQDGLLHLLQPGARPSGDPERSLGGPRRVAGEVGLVEESQDSVGVHTQILKNGLADLELLLPLRMATVDDMQHQVGVGDLLESALERGDQVMWQLANW